ncbi:MAG: asparagine synthase (glutamine-hydrolyzing) [Gammaproteobacteria bacterium]|nr:asparagine synthase (glutamine-hydrolyzing) [Gammaproteobacteria bacterium]
MCGIAFIYNNNGSDHGLHGIHAMVKALTHRGPDQQNAQISGHCALGHTRLSIVDIQGGVQPMVSDDERYSIVFNGEIYNYRTLRQTLEKRKHVFQTQSDTEVILRAYVEYGAACVKELRGMFAFAIYDSRSGELFVARDRVGIKPLYYYWNDGVLVGASEIKGVFAGCDLEPKFNLHSIQNFFKYQFSICPYTVFDSVLELPPGYTLSLSPGGEPKLREYWDLEFPLEHDHENFPEAYWLDRFEAALHDAVDSHMIGDVPIGAYLSGGIDSSTTAGLLAQHYPDVVNTFTVRFSNPNADESAITAGIADHIGVPLHQLTMDDSREGGYLDALEQTIYAIEQPQRMAVDVPFFLLSELVNNNNYKVVYTGEGADEILAGYDCYRQNNIRLWGNSLMDEEMRLQYYLDEFGDFAQDYMRMLAQLHHPQQQRQVEQTFGFYPVWRDLWHVMQGPSEGLFTGDFLKCCETNEQMQEMAAQIKPNVDGVHPLNQSLYMEVKTRLPGWILLKGDRLAMANGVEVRVPFLDHPLVELAAQIPPDLKLNGMDEKYILKMVMRDRLPQHPQQFKKRAFYTPIREWFFRDDLARELDRYLSREAILDSSLFDPDKVQQIRQKVISHPPPTNLNEYHYLMQLEWVLCCVLTIQMLHHLYIKKNGACFQNT